MNPIQNFSEKIDFKSLDCLRGIAALYVVINHCRANMMISGSQMLLNSPLAEWSFTTKVYYTLLQGTILGKEFVILFFILSGFSIAHSLATNKSIIDFYKRRFIRLYPPMLIALIWAYVVFHLCTKYGPFYNLSYSVFDNFEITVLNLLYIPSGSLIPQFWSLTYEVIFYILAPLIFLTFRNKFFFVSLTLLFFILFLFISPFEPFSSNIIVSFLCDYGIFFSIGIVLYNVIFKSKFIEILRNKFVFISSIIVLFPAMIIVKFLFGLHNKTSLILATIFSIILIVNFLHFRIRPPWLVFFGKMSYTIYITHFASIYFVLYIFYEIGLIGSMSLPNIWYLWILGVLGCLILALPFYYLAERPSKRYLEKLRTN